MILDLWISVINFIRNLCKCWLWSVFCWSLVWSTGRASWTLTVRVMLFASCTLWYRTACSTSNDVQQDHFHGTSKLGRMAFWIIYFPSWRLEIFLLKCPSALKLAIHWLLVKNKTFLDGGLFETPPRSVSSLSSQLATVTNCTIWVNSAILMSPSFVKCYINVTMQQYLSFPSTKLHIQKTSPVASGNKFAF